MARLSNKKGGRKPGKDQDARPRLMVNTSMWKAWQAGDRKAATAAIPDEVVDDLIVHGSPAECRAHVQRYVDNGVTTPALAVFPMGDPRQAVLDLAPR